jgi:hypothetical protein
LSALFAARKTFEFILRQHPLERLDKATGNWETVSSTSFVGLTFVIGPADGELYRITTDEKP